MTARFERKTLLLLLACMVANVACQDRWTEVSVNGGRVRVMMPGAPRTERDEGPASATVFGVDTGAGLIGLIESRPSVFYWVRSQPMPPGWTEEKAIATYIADRERNTTATPTVTRRSIVNAGRPATELIVKNRQSSLIARLYFIDSTLYTTEVLGYEEDLDSSTIDRFMNSFRVVE